MRLTDGRTGRAARLAAGASDCSPADSRGAPRQDRAGADAGSRAGQRRAEAEPRDLRLRDARHGPRLQADQPELVRHDARRPSCRRSRTSSARTAARSPACARAASACRASTPTDAGRAARRTFEFELFGTGVDEGQTTFRLRHAYGELGAVRRRPDLEPVHGHRRVPQLARVLGTDRHGVLPQRAGALDADQGDTQRDARARAAGRQRRPGRLRGPHRAAGRHGALPAARPLRRTTAVRGDWGYVRARRHRSGRSTGTTCSTTSSTCRATPPAGASTSARTSSSAQSDVVRLQFVFGEGIQNYMNDAPVDVGIVNNLGNPVTPIVGEPHADRSASWPSSTTPGTRSSAARSATRWQDIDNTDGQAADAFKTRPVRARQPALLPRCRT